MEAMKKSIKAKEETKVSKKRDIAEVENKQEPASVKSAAEI